MITNEFAKIPNCAEQAPAAPQKRGGLAGFFEGLFGSHSNENGPSLLEICKAQ
jgi:hypothetical protein